MMSPQIDRVADLETNLTETKSQLSQCVEFGQQLVASLNEAKANLDEAHHESEMLREENAELKASIVDAKSEIRNGTVRQEMFECEKQDILRDNDELKRKLNAATALAHSKTEELDRVVSMKAVAPRIHLLAALPKSSSSPSPEPLLQNSPRHGVSTDATTQTTNSGATVVSLETEVGRLQGLLKGAQDDLDHERRMRNEKAALTTIPSETNLMNSESYNFLEPADPATVHVTEPVFVAQKTQQQQKKKEIVSVPSASSVAVVGTDDKGGGCCIVM